MNKPVMLMILDGWGFSPDTKDNAVAVAKTPNLDGFIDKYPSTFLKCSGLDVGLPDGFMGNSEVGHLNIGAGRIVYQDLTRIDRAIKNGSFFENKNIVEAFKKVEESGGKLHLMGLLSDGGVHSHIRHLDAFLVLAQRRGFKDIVVHPLFDGRDTAPMVGHTYLKDLQDLFKKHGRGSIGSMSGRYYAMDRDKRWDRVEKAYRALVVGEPSTQKDPVSYVLESHAKNVGDEFIEPVCINPDKVISDGDVVIFYNFRADRTRQITRAFTEKDFSEFERKKIPNLSYWLCMTEYDERFDLPIAFPREGLNNIMGEVLSKNDLKQLRIAETEKYAHVTFFFNGGREEKFPGEDRILIDSPRDVATYDLKPEMSAPAVTQRIIKEVNRDYYDFIVINYANCDMVGHTGIFEAAVKAVETVDGYSSKVIEKVLERDGIVFLTADHGNVEKMKENDDPHTAHTTGDVRFIIISNQWTKGDIKLKQGRLADIMPTILKFMGLEIPTEVSGKNLIERNKG